MEKMKINSKTDYKRNRVSSGYGPHRILEMLQEEALAESTTNQIQKGSTHWSLNEEVILLLSLQKILRGEKMSTRSLDHCACGHNREDHDNFNGECEDCKCEVFHRNINTSNLIVKNSNN